MPGLKKTNKPRSYTHQEASSVFLESQSVIPAPRDLPPPVAEVPVHAPAHNHHLHKFKATSTKKMINQKLNPNLASIQSGYKNHTKPMGWRHLIDPSKIKT